MRTVAIVITLEQAEMIRAALMRDALNYTRDESYRKRENLAKYIARTVREETE